MDKADAKAVLTEHLKLRRSKTHAELADLIGNIDAQEITSPGGAEYQIEVEVFWDHQKGGDIRVLGSIDDGRWSAFRPLCEDFIIAPSGNFVGE